MPTPTTWIENTTGKYDHGGPGWGFGDCVWSPAVDRRGSEGKYRIMREPKPGDCVINCCDGLIRGTSNVFQACITTPDGPPKPGPWGYARAYYRLNLTGYTPLAEPVRLQELVERYGEEIRRDIETNRPKYYPFSLYPDSEFCPGGKIVPAQGRFLGKATPTLARLIRELLQREQGSDESAG